MTEGDIILGRIKEEREKQAFPHTMNILLKIGTAVFTVAMCLGQAPQAAEAQTPAQTPVEVKIPAAAFESAPGSLTGPGNTRTAIPASRVPAAAAPDSSGQGLPAARKAYVIGSLDVLDIRVWNDPKLSGLFDVRPDGIISMPLIGELRADGQTVAQLRETILQKLNTLMNSPEVNVQIARINSKRYFIFGEVARSGEFPLVAEITVLDALSNCGGFREFANPKKIYVLRGSKKLEFNYKDVSRGKNMGQNIVLENGDRIFVP